MTLDVLAIAARPGDAEASCGGALIRMAELGYRTGVLDLTPGDICTDSSAEDRLAQAHAAARCLGLAWRDNQHMPDARLENSLAARLTLAVRIRELRPRVVIVPYWESPDPDQIHCSELAVESCFLAGIARLEEYSAPHRPERILYASLFAGARPSFVVDISAQFDRRREALAAYSGSTGLIEARARYHGASIGVPYAEPFILKDALAVSDLVRLGQI